MTMLTSRNLVAFALVAIASLAFLSVGCSRDEGSRAASGEAAVQTATRIDDPEYVARLNETVDAPPSPFADRNPADVGSTTIPLRAIAITTSCEAPFCATRRS